MKQLQQLLETLRQVLHLPQAELVFDSRLGADNVRATHARFTRPHPRYKIIRYKTIGAALVDLATADTREKYLATIKGRNYGAYHARRARARGYTFADIDLNQHLDAIHAINTSENERQGRPMDEQYLCKSPHFELLPNFRYYGILNPDAQLVAYATFGIYGNFGAFSQLIGMRNNDGIMHLLVTETVGRAIDEGMLRYVMYDTFFGAQPGMQQFKTMLGFRPYHARYRLI